MSNESSECIIHIDYNHEEDKILLEIKNKSNNKLIFKRDIPLFSESKGCLCESEIENMDSKKDKTVQTEIQSQESENIVPVKYYRQTRLFSSYKKHESPVRDVQDNQNSVIYKESYGVSSFKFPEATPVSKNDQKNYCELSFDGTRTKKHKVRRNIIKRVKSDTKLNSRTLTQDSKSHKKVDVSLNSKLSNFVPRNHKEIFAYYALTEQPTKKRRKSFEEPAKPENASKQNTLEIILSPKKQISQSSIDHTKQLLGYKTRRPLVPKSKSKRIIVASNTLELTSKTITKDIEVQTIFQLKDFCKFENDYKSAKLDNINKKSNLTVKVFPCIEIKCSSQNLEMPAISKRPKMPRRRINPTENTPNDVNYKEETVNNSPELVPNVSEKKIDLKQKIACLFTDASNDFLQNANYIKKIDELCALISDLLQDSCEKTTIDSSKQDEFEMCSEEKLKLDVESYTKNFDTETSSRIHNKLCNRYRNRKNLPVNTRSPTPFIRKPNNSPAHMNIGKSSPFHNTVILHSNHTLDQNIKINSSTNDTLPHGTQSSIRESSINDNKTPATSCSKIELRTIPSDNKEEDNNEQDISNTTISQHQDDSVMTIESNESKSDENKSVILKVPRNVFIIPPHVNKILQNEAKKAEAQYFNEKNLSTTVSNDFSLNSSQNSKPNESKLIDVYKKSTSKHQSRKKISSTTPPKSPKSTPRSNKKLNIILSKKFNKTTTDEPSYSSVTFNSQVDESKPEIKSKLNSPKKQFKNTLIPIATIKRAKTLPSKDLFYTSNSIPNSGVTTFESKTLEDYSNCGLYTVRIPENNEKYHHRKVTDSKILKYKPRSVANSTFLSTKKEVVTGSSFQRRKEYYNKLKTNQKNKTDSFSDLDTGKTITNKNKSTVSTIKEISKLKSNGNSQLKPINDIKKKLTSQREFTYKSSIKKYRKKKKIFQKSKVATYMFHSEPSKIENDLFIKHYPLEINLKERKNQKVKIKPFLKSYPLIRGEYSFEPDLSSESSGSAETVGISFPLYKYPFNLGGQENAKNLNYPTSKKKFVPYVFNEIPTLTTFRSRKYQNTQTPRIDMSHVTYGANIEYNRKLNKFLKSNYYKILSENSAKVKRQQQNLLNYHFTTNYYRNNKNLPKQRSVSTSDTTLTDIPSFTNTTKKLNKNHKFTTFYQTDSWTTLSLKQKAKNRFPINRSKKDIRLKTIFPQQEVITLYRAKPRTYALNIGRSSKKCVKKKKSSNKNRKCSFIMPKCASSQRRQKRKTSSFKRCKDICCPCCSEPGGDSSIFRLPVRKNSKKCKKPRRASSRSSRSSRSSARKKRSRKKKQGSFTSICSRKPRRRRSSLCSLLCETKPKKRYSKHKKKRNSSRSSFCSRSSSKKRKPKKKRSGSRASSASNRSKKKKRRSKGSQLSCRRAKPKRSICSFGKKKKPSRLDSLSCLAQKISCVRPDVRQTTRSQTSLKYKKTIIKPKKNCSRKSVNSMYTYKETKRVQKKASKASKGSGKPCKKKKGSKCSLGSRKKPKKKSSKTSKGSKCSFAPCRKKKSKSSICSRNKKPRKTTSKSSKGSKYSLKCRQKQKPGRKRSKCSFKVCKRENKPDRNFSFCSTKSKPKNRKRSKCNVVKRDSKSTNNSRCSFLNRRSSKPKRCAKKYSLHFVNVADNKPNFYLTQRGKIPKYKCRSHTTKNVHTIYRPSKLFDNKKEFKPTELIIKANDMSGNAFVKNVSSNETLDKELPKLPNTFEKDKELKVISHKKYPIKLKTKATETTSKASLAFDKLKIKKRQEVSSSSDTSTSSATTEVLQDENVHSVNSSNSLSSVRNKIPTNIRKMFKIGLINNFLQENSKKLRRKFSKKKKENG